MTTIQNLMGGGLALLKDDACDHEKNECTDICTPCLLVNAREPKGMSANSGIGG